MPSVANREGISGQTTILPIWYLGTLGGLAGSYALMAHGNDAGRTMCLLTLLVAMPLLFVIEHTGRQRFSIPEPSARSAERAWLFGQAFLFWIFLGVAVVLGSHFAGHAVLGSMHAFSLLAGWMAAWPPVARMVIAFLLLDLWSYTRHRLEHAAGERNPLWRYIHWRHHVPTDVNLWTGMMIHGMEVILVFAAPCFLFGALGFAQWEVLFLFCIFLTITSPQHMNSGYTSGAFRHIIHGPEAHIRHHAANYKTRNANFADCLTIWDRLFGTFVATGDNIFSGPFGA